MAGCGGGTYWDFSAVAEFSMLYTHGSVHKFWLQFQGSKNKWKVMQLMVGKG